MNDLFLLAALLPGPRHGYALKQQVGLLTGKGTLHNNLVYPLLRRFVENGWVNRRQAEGERGQTREVYALTAKGKRELLGRLGTYGEEEAASEAGFRLRVGLVRISQCRYARPNPGRSGQISGGARGTAIADYVGDGDGAVGIGSGAVFSRAGSRGAGVDRAAGAQGEARNSRDAGCVTSVGPLGDCRAGESDELSLFALAWFVVVAGDYSV